jgi:hypothetical protein
MTQSFQFRQLLRLGALVMLTMASPAFASQLTVICNGLAGCDGPGVIDMGATAAANGNMLSNRVIPVVAGAMLNIAAGLSLVFIVISGYRMVISAGDDSKFNAGRSGIIFSLVGLSIAVTASAIVSFVISENYGQAVGPAFFLYGTGGIMGATVAIILTVMNVSLILMIIYGGMQMILGGGKTDGFQNGWKTIKFAIIGAIVVNIARWLVEATLTTIL